MLSQFFLSIALIFSRRFIIIDSKQDHQIEVIPHSSILRRFLLLVASVLGIARNAGNR